MATNDTTKPIWTPVLFGLVWLAVIAIGAKYLFLHEFTPGVQEPAPLKLPTSLAAYVPSNSDKIIIVMAIHPNCPCTEASVEQLDRLQTRFPDTFQTVAFFWTENDSIPESSLAGNAYWERVGKMDATVRSLDPNGILAASFGANVSGSVAAYDSAGELRFQGGLTATRGHAGQSRGFDLLAALAKNTPMIGSETALTFGCELNGGQDT